jgi:hypothetical protein
MYSFILNSAPEGKGEKKRKEKKTSSSLIKRVKRTTAS